MREGFTLVQAGAALGLSPSYLCEIENGKKDFSTSVIRKFLKTAPDFFTANDFYQPVA